MGLVLSVRRRVRIVSGVTAISADGANKLESVRYRAGSNAETSLPADTLLLHQGVVPNVNLAMSVGIEHRWDDEQLCWVPMVDGYGGTAVDGIAVAGDGAGVP
jgi:hypothetical protein